MPTIVRFEVTEVWQTSRELTRLVHKLTRQREFARDFGLCDRMRRASVSIMSYIAEGFESRTQNFLTGYVGHAKVSAGGLTAQTYVAREINYSAKQMKAIREEGI